MEQITFEIKSMLKFQLDIVEYPELTSDKKWVQKGVDMLKKHAPRVLKYLSKQRVMSQLKDFKVIFKLRPKRRKRRTWRKKKQNYTAPKRRERWIKNFFKIWVQKEKFKRLILSILESLVIPFTPILALLPGPNVFFYIPALLLYYHFTAYLGLRKVDVDDLDITILYVEDLRG